MNRMGRMQPPQSRDALHRPTTTNHSRYGMILTLPPVSVGGSFLTHESNQEGRRERDYVACCPQLNLT